jgi:hypothetical protein
MPPVMFGILQAPFTRLAYILFPTPVANGIIAGSFAFCKWVFTSLRLVLIIVLQMSFTTVCITRESGQF